LLFVDRALEQPRVTVPIADREKEQAMALAMGPKRAAVLELAQVFHMDRGPGA